MKSKAQIINEREISLQIFSQMENESIYYKDFVSMVFPGERYERIRRKIFGQDLVLFDKLYEEKFLRLTVKEEEAHKLLEDEKNFIKKKEQEYEKCVEEFERAKKALQLAERNLKNAKIVLNDFEQQLADVQQLIKREEQKRAKRKTRILVHPSAMLTQIRDNSEGIFVATRIDTEALGKLGCCIDYVFEESVNLIEKIPYALNTRISEDESVKSIIAFANMAVYFLLDKDEETEVKLLFASEEIAELLKYNGFTENL